MPPGWTRPRSRSPAAPQLNLVLKSLGRRVTAVLTEDYTSQRRPGPGKKLSAERTPRPSQDAQGHWVICTELPQEAFRAGRALVGRPSGGLHFPPAPRHRHLQPELAGLGVDLRKRRHKRVHWWRRVRSARSTRHADPACTPSLCISNYTLQPGRRRRAAAICSPALCIAFARGLFLLSSRIQNRRKEDPLGIKSHGRAQVRRPQRGWERRLRSLGQAQKEWMLDANLASRTREVGCGSTMTTRGQLLH
ncbi:hypothetical protein QTO34_010449 [Cnephaeus nilssonii]|uniref:Uncharacterized protein n=1 Tax=Cnephaeus nilssonii TaxID=3371016 RepID=A0AA40HGG3_CNENI|nr:hypothetical protein QTO34_010449 [Eptesicus nilssonii]